MSPVDPPVQLQALRDQIDNADAELIATLARRFALTDEVGRLKRVMGMPAQDARREADQLDRIRDLAGRAGLDQAIAERVLRLIVDAVVTRHSQF